MPAPHALAPLLLALLLASGPGQAGIYKCPAPGGGLAYQDIPCPTGQALPEAPPADPAEAARTRARTANDIQNAQALERQWEDKQRRAAADHARREQERLEKARRCNAYEEEARQLERRGRSWTLERHRQADAAEAQRLRDRHFSECFASR
ncbi:MAG: DUF4124 domain-containing protein [Rhodocyclaceae bacterium]|jgi:hypothetical protein|nr:DUF4124 domain-containing protein [Rhodocyclaceae bacterium]